MAFSLCRLPRFPFEKAILGPFDVADKEVLLPGLGTPAATRATCSIRS
jgi:hypothetical protein